MALKKTTTASIGFLATDAYHRVEGIMLASKNRLEFRVRVYKDASGNFPAFDDKGFSCAYDISGNNPIAQAYGHLKTLADYIDATDC